MRSGEINTYADLGTGETRADRIDAHRWERIEADADALATEAQRRKPDDTVRALVWLSAEWRSAPTDVDDAAVRQLAMDALVEMLTESEWRVWTAWNLIGMKRNLRARVEAYAEGRASFRAITLTEHLRQAA